MQDLADPGPYTSCFLNLVPDGSDVLVIVGKDFPKISE